MNEEPVVGPPFYLRDIAIDEQSYQELIGSSCRGAAIEIGRLILISCFCNPRTLDIRRRSERLRYTHLYTGKRAYSNARCFYAIEKCNDNAWSVMILHERPIGTTFDLLFRCLFPTSIRRPTTLTTTMNIHALLGGFIYFLDV